MPEVYQINRIPDISREPAKEGRKIILEVGVGNEPYFSKYGVKMAPGTSFIGADFYSDIINHLNQKQISLPEIDVEFRHMDGRKLNLSDQCVDEAVLSNVLSAPVSGKNQYDYINDEPGLPPRVSENDAYADKMALMSEVFRVIKPGGKLILYDNPKGIIHKQTFNRVISEIQDRFGLSVDEQGSQNETQRIQSLQTNDQGISQTVVRKFIKPKSNEK